MAETIFRGAAYSAGSLIDGRIEPTDGPGLEYQANCFPDIRYFPTRKDGLYPGRVPSFLNSPFTVLTDNVPSAFSASSISSVAGTTNGTALVLTTVAPGGGAAGVPSLCPVQLVPFQKSGVSAVSVLAIDFGFTTGNTTAGAASVPVPDSSLFVLGEWICIGGAGNAAKTASLFTQVIGSADATHITVSPAPAGTLTNAPIGRTNLTSGAYTPPQAYPPGIQTQPTGVFPYSVAGLAAIFNPVEAITRAVSITGVVGGTGGAFIVRGYDIYGVPHAETITVGAGAVTGWGKTALKYIASVTPQFTDAHAYTVGTSDVFGINLRSDKWEFMNEFWNGSFATTSSGWTQALQPTAGPATATTADVRGTVQTSANGGGATPSAPLNVASNGVIRLMLAMTVPLYNDIFGTPINQVPMFGLPQFTQ